MLMEAVVLQIPRIMRQLEAGTDDVRAGILAYAPYERPDELRFSAAADPMRILMS